MAPTKRPESLYLPIHCRGGKLFWGAHKEVRGQNLETAEALPVIVREDTVRALSYLPASDVLGVGDDAKSVATYTASTGALKHNYPDQCKKVTTLELVPSRHGDFMLFGDRYGDVRKINLAQESDERLEEGESSGQLALGHLCASISSMTLSTKQNLLVTGDCDEKIRVSVLSKPYHTTTYCLGHAEFVSSIQLVDACPGLLVSAGGDGVVLFFDAKSGALYGGEPRLLPEIQLQERALISLQVKPLKVDAETGDATLLVVFLMDTENNAPTREARELAADCTEQLGASIVQLNYKTKIVKKSIDAVNISLQVNADVPLANVCVTNFDDAANPQAIFDRMVPGAEADASQDWMLLPLHVDGSIGAPLLLKGEAMLNATDSESLLTAVVKKTDKCLTEATVADWKSKKVQSDLRIFFWRFRGEVFTEADLENMSDWRKKRAKVVVPSKEMLQTFRDNVTDE